MEREVHIRYEGDYFGSLLYFYENTGAGRVQITRKSPKQVTIGDFTNVDMIEQYSHFEPFQDDNMPLDDLLKHDCSRVLHYFRDEIAENNLDVRNFNLYYLDHLTYTKTLYDQDRGVVGALTITINPLSQTKNLFFNAICPELEKVSQRVQQPFEKINRQMMFEFWHQYISKVFPNSHFW